MRLFPAWEELKIKEETEDGRLEESVIRLPPHPSTPLASLLHRTVSAVNRCVMHTLSADTQHSVVSRLCAELVTSYESLCETSNQNVALQLLFDVKLVQNLFVHKDFGLTDRILKTVRRLEAVIDPFDLSVFSPHLNTAMKGASQRLLVSSVLRCVII